MSLHQTLPAPVHVETGFLRDVLRGLARRPKQLPCKYFYDERGCELFEQICGLDEYYPTRTELGIMHRHVHDMAGRLGPGCQVIEFGSGSGTKTQVLLDHLVDPAAYIPVEIAPEALELSTERLAARYPGLAVLPVCADFTRDFELPVEVQ